MHNILPHAAKQFVHASHIIFLTVILLAISRSAVADTLPLDDPWIKFCLLNVDAEDLDDCINGFPAESVRKLTTGTGLELEYSLSFRVKRRGDEPTTNSTFICPHEFGDACNLLIDSVLAFGGSCRSGEQNTVCHLP